MCSDTIHGRIYDKLLDLIPDLHSIDHAGKSLVKNSGPLLLRVLDRTPPRILVLLTHQFAFENGEVVPDPEVEISINLNRHMAQAFSYRSALKFQRICVGDQIVVNSRDRMALNTFLDKWLETLIIQGHIIG
jgi:uncharacterized protein YqiB (DUF1249 family)